MAAARRLRRFGNAEAEGRGIDAASDLRAGGLPQPLDPACCGCEDESPFPWGRLP